MVPPGIGAVEDRVQADSVGQQGTGGQDAANRSGSPSASAATTSVVGPGARRTSAVPAAARAEANIRKVTASAGTPRVGRDVAGGACADAVGTSAVLEWWTGGLVGGEADRLIGQPPIADIGRSGWVKAGSSMPCPRCLSATSPCISAASDASSGAAAQQRAQVGLALGEQAGAPVTVGGQPDAVAGVAERVGHRPDDAHGRRPAVDRELLGRGQTRARAAARGGSRRVRGSRGSPPAVTIIARFHPCWGSSGICSMNRRL